MEEEEEWPRLESRSRSSRLGGCLRRTHAGIRAENARGVIVGSPQEKERMVADVSASRAIANGGEAEHGSGTFMAAEPSLSRVLSHALPFHCRCSPDQESGQGRGQAAVHLPAACGGGRRLRDERV